VWTYSQAQKALPYVASIVRSLREHQLEALRCQLDAERLARQPGRPARAALIAHEEATRGAEQAEERFQESLEELHTLDIYCLDPVQGLALIPFAHQEQLAWFVFDLFDGNRLRFWRFHEDPLETRRPIAAVDEAAGGSMVV
jgi:hypothetical protein